MNAAVARRPLPIVMAAIAALAVAGLGALMTDLGPWYQSLRQPAWKPPDALFGPAWTLIYGVTALAGLTAWERATDRKMREWLLVLFSLNAFLNVLWSLLYFRLRRPDWAMFEVCFFWSSIVALIAYLAPRCRKASLLLLPYLVWVTFAAALNYASMRLNGPFGG